MDLPGNRVTSTQKASQLGKTTPPRPIGKGVAGSNSCGVGRGGRGRRFLAAAVGKGAPRDSRRTNVLEVSSCGDHGPLFDSVLALCVIGFLCRGFSIVDTINKIRNRLLSKGSL